MSPVAGKLRVIHDVTVVPVTRVHQHVATGGPIWPEFARQTGVRHCRNGKPVDEAPEAPEQAAVLGEDAVWGGFLDSHFGHFVADHLSRLPFALRERPDDVVLFTVDPGMTREGLGSWVWQVFDWIGLDRDRVRLVTEPVRVRCLRVGRQAETLAQVGPDEDYLDLIAGWGRKVAPQRVPLLYVGRMGLAADGGGVHAGEGYVASLMQGLGVAVLDPARAGLRDQMAAYAGAETIVFAEGSALHGRQLLGRIDQDIAVIRRRPGKRMAEAQITPRCRSLTYLDVGAEGLMAYWKSGAKRPNPAMSLYDVPRLQRMLGTFGIDLAPIWNDADFAAAALADVDAWVKWHQPRDKHLAEYRATLAGVGLEWSP